MTMHASHRWMCLLSGLLAGLLSVGGPTLATSATSNSPARALVVGHALANAVLAARSERSGSQVAARDELSPLTCDSAVDIDDDSDGSERLAAAPVARVHRLPRSAAAWTVSRGNLLRLSFATRANTRLQI